MIGDVVSGTTPRDIAVYDLSGESSYLNSMANVLSRVSFTKQIYKTFNASGGSETLNLFQIEGHILVKRIFAIVNYTDLGNHTKAYFDLNDGTNTVILTESSTGADLSNLDINSMFYKVDGITNAIQYVKSNSSVKFESTDSFYNNDWIVLGKYGGVTYLRYNYESTDTPTQGDATFFIEYIPLTTSSYVWEVY